MSAICCTIRGCFALAAILGCQLSASAQKSTNNVPPLDPQCKAFVDALFEQKAPGWETMTPGESREVFASLTDLFGTGPADVRVVDLTVRKRIPLRLYMPPKDSEDGHALPVVVYFHGGGWVLGDIETHDALCRRLSALAKCAVVSVGYRRAPEHPFPAPLDDCYDAVQYVAAHAQELGVDSSRVAVAGDSSGGNLAAAVALRSRDRSGPRILAQVLIYPALSPKCDSNSYTSYENGYGLTKPSMQWFWAQYLGKQRARAYASPPLADSLKGLPTTVLITAQYDVLRDEAEAYGQQLQAAGVTVTHRRYGGMIHGFVHFPGAFDRGKQATQDIAEDLKKLFSCLDSAETGRKGQTKQR